MPHAALTSCFRASRWDRAMTWFALTVGLLGVAPALMAQAPQQRAMIAEMRVQVRRAGNLFRERKYQESGKLVAQIQEAMDKLAAAGDPAVVKALAGVHDSLKKAHALLELEGVRLPPLKDPADAGKPGGVPATEGPSFVRDVAPMLVVKCGRCHIDNMRGMFSVASYAALMKGNNDGKVVFAKDADGSRLVEVIVSGDMPRGGTKVSPQELDQLKKWILAGAAFDGPDPAAPLSTYTDAQPEAAMTVTAKLATGKETVSFARDIAPILAEQCAGCHGNGRQASGGFNLATFQPMLNGGDNGPPILPGKSGDSLLIKKLKGEADGERMPRGRPALADDVVARIATWIDEGATFDGADLQQNIGDVAEVAQALAATHEELSLTRAEKAPNQWRLCLPGVPVHSVESTNFLLLGDLPESSLQRYAEQAEGIAGKAAALFGRAADGPLVKGRITLFIMQERYDYGEFGKMVERRDPPPGQQAHFKFDIVNAYIAMMRPKDDGAALDSVLAEQITGVYLSAEGAGLVRRGAGRVAASRLVEGDPRAGRWDDELPMVLAQMKMPDDAIEGRLSPEQNRIANYAFVKFLMKDSRRTQRVLQLTRQGEDFYQAFSQTYRAGPAQLTTLWLRSR